MQKADKKQTTTAAATTKKQQMQRAKQAQKAQKKKNKRNKAKADSSSDDDEGPSEQRKLTQNAANAAARAASKVALNLTILQRNDIKSAQGMSFMCLFPEHVQVAEFFQYNDGHRILVNDGTLRLFCFVKSTETDAAGVWQQVKVVRRQTDNTVIVERFLGGGFDGHNNVLMLHVNCDMLRLATLPYAMQPRLDFNDASPRSNNNISPQGKPAK